MIITPPTDLRRYLVRHLDQIESLLKRVAELQAEVERIDNSDSQRMLASWLRYIGDDLPLQYVGDARYFAFHRVERLQLDWLRDTLQSPLRHGREFLRFIPAAATVDLPLSTEETCFFKALANVGEGAAKWGYQPGDPANKEDTDYTGAMALAAALEEAGKLLSEAEAVSGDLRARIGALLSVSSLDPHKWRPEHGDVETLWHASLYADQLGNMGFQPTKPMDRKGLGNFGNQPTISLTAELEIAQGAADCFLDVWDIAHGIVTPADVLKRIREEKLEINFNSHFGAVDVETLATPLDAMKLYRLYMAFTTSRSNPVFVNPEELLAAVSHVSRDSIGVVACETRLDDTAEFILGEAEFRVTTDHIADVKRIDHVPAASLATRLPEPSLSPT